MKLNPIASNMTEVEIGDTLVLFSYKTPVACRMGGHFYRTEKHWSVTTSRHINKWFRDIFSMTDAEIKEEVSELPQITLDRMCETVPA